MCRVCDEESVEAGGSLKDSAAAKRSLCGKLFGQGMRQKGITVVVQGLEMPVRMWHVAEKE